LNEALSHFGFGIIGDRLDRGDLRLGKDEGDDESRDEEDNDEVSFTLGSGEEALIRVQSESQTHRDTNNVLGYLQMQLPFSL
jgi:hypothetical protein